MTVSRFETIYLKKTKHRKRCPFCSKLIQDGEAAVFEKTREEKLYPVKGLMVFSGWHIYHLKCHRRMTA